jgi:triacylglycerol lipase
MNSATKVLPTILVPGWMDNVRTMRRFAAYLEGIGQQPVICSPQPSNGSARIEVLAEQLAQFIVARFGSDEPVNLFGFSMGGLIDRYYLQKLGGVKRVQKLVTVATPHQGTMTARIFPFVAAVQMRPGSDFLSDLNGDLSTLEQVEFTSIWTPFDLTIVPSTSSVLPVGESKRVYAAAHGLIPYDPFVMRTVGETLSG